MLFVIIRDGRGRLRADQMLPVNRIMIYHIERHAWYYVVIGLN